MTLKIEANKKYRTRNGYVVTTWANDTPNWKVYPYVYDHPVTGRETVTAEGKWHIRREGSAWDLVEEVVEEPQGKTIAQIKEENNLSFPFTVRKIKKTNLGPNDWPVGSELTVVSMALDNRGYSVDHPDYRYLVDAEAWELVVPEEKRTNQVEQAIKQRLVELNQETWIRSTEEEVSKKISRALEDIGKTIVTAESKDLINGMKGMTMKEKIMQKAQQIRETIRPYDNYILAVAALITIDHFLLKGKYRDKTVQLATRLADRLSSMIDKLIDKIGG